MIPSAACRPPRHPLGEDAAVWDPCYRRLLGRIRDWGLRQVGRVETTPAGAAVIAHGCWRFERRLGSPDLYFFRRCLRSGAWEACDRAAIQERFNLPLCWWAPQQGDTWTSNLSNVVSDLLAADPEVAQASGTEPEALRRLVWNALLPRAEGSGRLILKQSGWGLRAAVWKHLVDREVFRDACTVYWGTRVNFSRYCGVLAHRHAVSHWRRVAPRLVCRLGAIPANRWADPQLFQPSNWCEERSRPDGRPGFPSLRAAQRWLAAPTTVAVKRWSRNVEAVWADIGGLRLPPRVQLCFLGALQRFVDDEDAYQWTEPSSRNATPFRLGCAGRFLIQHGLDWLNQDSPGKKERTEGLYTAVRAVCRDKYPDQFRADLDLPEGHPWKAWAQARRLGRELPSASAAVVRKRL